MQIDFSTLSPRDRYKLLVSSVVPRPIALVSTLDEHGVLNAAPFSFFNVFGDTPPTAVIGVNAPGPGALKDTGRNIRERNEFVINLVSEEMAHEMNITAAIVEPDIDEVDLAGLTTAPSTQIETPYIVESPIAFECKKTAILELHAHCNLVIGEILVMHIRDELIDTEKFYIDTPAANLIGRMHGRGGYLRTTDRFEIPRLNAEETEALVRAKREGK